MFSIIIPYYKNSSVIKRCLDSVVNQTFDLFEVIIVDDFSCDNIEEIIESYDDRRIKLMKHLENKGVSSARNTGIKNSKFDWICFIDSDDSWEPNHLQIIFSLIKKYNIIKMFCTSYRVNGRKVYSPSKVLPWRNGEDFITNNLFKLIYTYGQIIHTNSICIHKTCFQKYGMFDENSHIGEDLDMWYRCVAYEDIVFSTVITSNYFRDASLLTKTTNFEHGWCFCNRLELLRNSRIPIEKRKSIKIIIDRYKLSECKHYVAEGEKKQAIEMYRSISSELPKELRKSKFQLFFLLCCPSIFSKTISNYIFKKQLKKF